MHKALNNDDILRQIFSFLRTSYSPDHECRATTPYHAALVCRRFTPHALDSLWFFSNDLEPLVSLIPCTKKHRTGVSLTRPLRVEDLLIFEPYARRIKEFHLRWDVSGGIRTSLILEILRCSMRSHLLPNLRSLFVECDDEEADIEGLSCFFLRDGIQELIFDASDGDENSFRFIFPNLINIAPHLKSLKLRAASIPDDLLALTASFPYLQELCTDNHFIISPKSSSTFLGGLISWDGFSFRFNDRETSMLGPKFVILQRLTIRDPACAEDIVTLFNVNPFPNLQTIEIRIRNRSAYDQGRWGELFRSLFNPNNHLQHITIGVMTAVIQQGDVERGDIFAALDGVPPQHLKTLEVNRVLVFPLLRSSISNLSVAFPHLTELVIHAGVPMKKRSLLASFNQISSLALALPCLILLRISIDGRPRPRDAPLPVLSHELRDLWLDLDTNIPESPTFARNIDVLFPDVKVHDATVSGDTRIKRFDEMVNCLKVIKLAREDQETRVAQRMSASQS